MSPNIVKKLAKRIELLFMAVGRPISLNPSKRMKTNSSELVVTRPQGMNEGEKRKQMKLEDPKTDFKLVQERE